MDEQEKQLDEFYKKYSKKGYDELIQDVRDVLSDVEYFKEHISRAKRTGFFSFDLRLSCPGLIFNFFFQKIDAQTMNEVLRDEEYLVRFFKIYHTLSSLIKATDKWDEQRKDKDVKRLVDFSKIVEWFLGLKLDDYLHAFIGCSAMSESLRAHINRLHTGRP